MTKLRTVIASSVVALSGAASAGVDKVYSPYVEMGELELETRGIYVQDDDDAVDGTQKIKLGLGYGLNQRVFLEGYLIVEDEPGESAEVEAVEVEAKFQLSEAGEHWLDYGMLVELEKELEEEVWELKTGPLLSKDFGSFTTTLNLFAEYKFGADVDGHEIETLGSGELRYRWKPELQLAAQLYADEDTVAAGPVLFGETHLAKAKVAWDLGVMFALNDETPDSILRWQMEFEF